MAYEAASRVGGHYVDRSREESCGRRAVVVAGAQLVVMIVEGIAVVRVEVDAEVVADVRLAAGVEDAGVVAPRRIVRHRQLRRPLVVRCTEIAVHKGGGHGAAPPQIDLAAVGAAAQCDAQQARRAAVGIPGRSHARVLDAGDVARGERVEVVDGRGYSVDEYHRGASVDTHRTIDGIGLQPRQRQQAQQPDARRRRAQVGGRGVYDGAPAGVGGRAGRHGEALEQGGLAEIHPAQVDALGACRYAYLGGAVARGRYLECGRLARVGVECKPAVVAGCAGAPAAREPARRAGHGCGVAVRYDDAAHRAGGHIYTYQGEYKCKQDGAHFQTFYSKTHKGTKK